MKIVGDWESRDVYVDGKRLYPDLSQKIVNHSPDGFNWGYGGSAPAQLALALLLLVTDADTAQRLHQEFKSEVIASWEQANVDTIIDVRRWVKQHGGRISYANKENSFVGKNSSERPHCTRGHESQCFYAGSQDCECQCGGENHGKGVTKH